MVKINIQAIAKIFVIIVIVITILILNYFLQKVSNQQNSSKIVEVIEETEHRWTVIKETKDYYTVEVPFDTLLNIPKNGKWVKNPSVDWKRYRLKTN